MKLNFGKRIVLFIHWLVSLALVAALIFPEYLSRVSAWLQSSAVGEYLQIVFIALLAVYSLLSIAVLCMIFRRGGAARSERGFITVDSSETGKVRIAISAIEQMVKQAVHAIDGIADMKICITNADDAIAIQVNVTMVNGSHVPTVTLNMQRSIRQFVEMNCGVAVRSVSINIQAVVNSAESGRKSKRADARIQPAAENYAIPEQPVPEPVTVQPESVRQAAEDNGFAFAASESGEGTQELDAGSDADSEDSEEKNEETNNERTE